MFKPPSAIEIGEHANLNAFSLTPHSIVLGGFDMTS